ncbi:MAG: hypothetical protein RXO22_08275 [Thermocladium sp.]
MPPYLPFSGPMRELMGLPSKSIKALLVIQATPLGVPSSLTALTLALPYLDSTSTIPSISCVYSMGSGEP